MTLEHVGSAKTRIDRVLRLVIRPAIYGERMALTVEAHHVHGEPISVADARARVVRAVRGRPALGRRVGHHVVPDARRRSPSVGRDRRSWRSSTSAAATWSGFTAEGLVWEGDQPVQGLHLKHREYVVARPAAGGEPVELLIEAAANPIPPWSTSPWPLLMPDFDGPPIYRLGQAELAVVRPRRRGAVTSTCSCCGSCSTVVPADAADNPLRSSLPFARARTARVRLRSTPTMCAAIDVDDVARRRRRRRRSRVPAGGRDAHRRERDRSRAHRHARGCGRSARRSASARAPSRTRCGSWRTTRSTASRRRRRSSTRG